MILPALSTVVAVQADTGPNSWMHAKIGGTVTPGTIPKDGIRGLDRETGWDEQAGKGTKGATLVRKSQPPARGSITLQLFTPQDFNDWDAFVSNVLSVPADKQTAEGLSFFHSGQPTSGGITSVVVKKYTLIPRHMGRGMYHVTIDLIEWTPPPAATVVSTVATDASDQTGRQPVSFVRQPPAVALAQVQLENAQAAAAAGNPNAPAPG